MFGTRQVILVWTRLTVNTFCQENLPKKGRGRSETVCDEHELVLIYKHYKNLLRIPPLSTGRNVTPPPKAHLHTYTNSFLRALAPHLFEANSLPLL